MRIALKNKRWRGGNMRWLEVGESIRVHDVFNRQLVLELLPGLRIPTSNFVRHTQRKPRIRLLDQHADSHIYLILSALLLLPKAQTRSVRRRWQASGLQDNFSVLSIPFDVVG